MSTDIFDSVDISSDDEESEEGSEEAPAEEKKPSDAEIFLKTFCTLDNVTRLQIFDNLLQYFCPTCGARHTSCKCEY